MSNEVYSRRGCASLKKQSALNTPVIPDTFFEFNKEETSADYLYGKSMPVIGNRAEAIGIYKSKLPAPVGTIEINVEPKTFGHFLNGLFGGLSSGNVMPITTASAGFTVGETITGGSSSKTATVVADVDSNYLLLSSPSGDFTNGETVTGGGSKSTAVVVDFDSTVYGHVGSCPTELDTYYTLQINYVNNAIRYIGCHFYGIDGLGQNDNVLTATMKMMALGQFRHAKVTAITGAGAGAKTISVDQTYGIIATDSIKVFRPSTGLFLDFASAGVKTHSITSITNSTSFVVTNLETALAVGDLIMLAPQTPSYTTVDEFFFNGGTVAKIGGSNATLATADIEEFSFVIDNELEERHPLNSSGVLADRFPTLLVQRKNIGSGEIKTLYRNETFYSYFRQADAGVLEIVSTGGDIGSTTLDYLLSFRYGAVRFNKYDTALDVDNLVEEAVPFEAFYNSTVAYLAKVLLINNISSY